MRASENLLVGAVVLAGCVDRTLTGDGETSTSEDSSTDEGAESTTDDTGTTDAATTETTEAETSETGYYPGPECMHDYHCPVFELCIDHECQSAGEPPPSCGLPEFDIPTTLESDFGPLAMTFVDLDDDGRDELVTMTGEDFYVYESGWNIPTQVLGCQFYGTYVIPGLAAGHFDDQPGEDIVYVAEGDIRLCFSDGVGDFSSQVLEASSTPHQQVIAGDFDEQPPMDLIAFGNYGADLYLLGNGVVPLSNEELNSASAFDFGAPGAGVALLEYYYGVAVVDFFGNAQAELPTVPDNPRTMTGISSPDAARYVVSTQHYGNSGMEWFTVALHDPGTLVEGTRVLVDDAWVLVPGDFDGDQAQDLFVTNESSVWGGATTVVFGLFDEPCVAPQELGTDSYVTAHAVGDHDGDGDDEVALAFGTQSFLLLDVE